MRPLQANFGKIARGPKSSKMPKCMNRRDIFDKPGPIIELLTKFFNAKLRKHLAIL